MAFTKLHSIYGRMLGISSTGGVISAVTSTGARNSTDFGMSFQAWGPEMIETSTGGTLKNVGTSIISTAVSAATTFTLSAPTVAGVLKEIISASSALAVQTIDAGAVGISFLSTGSAASGGSTAIALGSTTTGSVGRKVTLRSASTARWLVLDQST